MTIKLTQGIDINWHYINTVEQLQELLQIIKDIDTFVLDTETYALKKYGDKASALDPHTARVSLVQLNFEGNYNPYIIDVIKIGAENVLPLIQFLAQEHILKLFHNACVPLDTQALTKEGWKLMTELKPNDFVMGSKNGRQCWTKVIKYINGGVQPVIKSYNSRRSWVSTGDHRWLCESKKNVHKTPYYQEKYLTTNDLKSLNDVPTRICHSFPYINENPCLITTDEAALLAWLWADGTIYKQNHKNGNSYYQCSITQSENNNDYCSKIETILTNLGCKITKYTLPESPHISRFSVPVKIVREIYEKLNLQLDSKDYSKFILEFSFEALTSWCEHFWYAEGSKGNPFMSTFCQYKSVNSEKVQALALAGQLLGYTPIISKDEMRVNFGKPSTSVRRLKHEVQLKVPVGCLQTETSNWVMRQGDFITITGNSFDLKQIKSTFGIWLPNVYCTKVLMQTLGISIGFKGSQIRGHSLLSLARDYFDIFLDKTESKSDWSQRPLSKIQQEYAALDVGSTKESGIDSIVLQGYYVIKDTLINTLDEEEVMIIDQQAMYVTARVEYAGLYIDTAMLEIIRDKSLAEMTASRFKLCAALNLQLQQEVIFEDGEFKQVTVVPDKVATLLNNNKGLVHVINETLSKTTGKKLNSLQAGELEKVLKEIEEERDEEQVIDREEKEDFKDYGSELIKDLLNYKTYNKLLSESLKYSKIINPVTNRVHAGLNAIGAATSRMSSSGDLNLQQISSLTMKLNIPESLLE